MKNAITIYSSATCPKCKMIKMKLDRAGIKYEVCEDVATMQNLGIMGLPALGLVTTDSHDQKIIKDFTQINAIVNQMIQQVAADGSVEVNQGCATCQVPTSKN